MPADGLATSGASASAGMVQLTPVISRLLGAKIRELELSGSPVILREGHGSRLSGSQTHTLVSATLKQFVER